MIRTLLACLFIAASALHAEAPALPPEALALLPTTPLKPTKPASNEGSITEVESTAAPTKTVWRMQSPAKLEKSYNLSLSRTFSGRIEKDQVCLFVIQARAVEGATADGKGKISVAAGHELGFLEVLDRRRYELELVKGQPERFRAASRTKLNG